MKRYEFIAKEVADRLGEEYTVKYVSVKKNNGVELEGFTVRKSDSNIAPTIYFNPEDTDDEIIEHILKSYDEAGLPTEFNQIDFTNWDWAKDRIYPTLYNKGLNDYEELVTRDFCSDLGIYYRVFVTNSTIGMGTVKITRELAKTWNVTEYDLYKSAMENLDKVVTIQNVVTVMDNMMSGIDEPKERTIEIDNSLSPLHVISGIYKTNDASAILLIPELIKNEELEDKDYIIIPSSIHECLLLDREEGESGMNADILKAMITDVNGTQLGKQDVLANHPFIYKADEKIFDEYVA